MDEPTNGVCGACGHIHEPAPKKEDEYCIAWDESLEMECGCQPWMRTIAALRATERSLRDTIERLRAGPAGHVQEVVETQRKEIEALTKRCEAHKKTITAQNRRIVQYKGLHKSNFSRRGKLRALVAELRDEIRVMRRALIARQAAAMEGR